MSSSSNGKKTHGRSKSKEELMKLPREELVSKISHLQSRVDDLERKLAKQEKTLNCSKKSSESPHQPSSIPLLTNGTAIGNEIEKPEATHQLINSSLLDSTDGVGIKNALALLAQQEEKFRQQQLEASRRENVLVMRLTTKEQEVQDYLAQLEELRTAVTSTGHIKHTLLDPAVNAMFQRMKSELEETKVNLRQSQQEFEAWKFTPDSIAGKKLMAKCRMLIDENSELGKATCIGRVATLENELSLSRKLCDDFQNSQTDIEAILLEMDENTDGLQSTAASLQRRCDELTLENESLRRRLGGDASVGVSCGDAGVKIAADAHRSTDGRTELMDFDACPAD